MMRMEALDLRARVNSTDPATYRVALDELAEVSASSARTTQWPTLGALMLGDTLGDQLLSKRLLELRGWTPEKIQRQGVPTGLLPHLREVIAEHLWASQEGCRNRILHPPDVDHWVLMYRQAARFCRTHKLPMVAAEVRVDGGSCSWHYPEWEKELTSTIWWHRGRLVVGRHPARATEKFEYQCNMARIRVYKDHPLVDTSIIQPEYTDGYWHLHRP